MVTRSDVLEKFFGRRLVSCLGWSLLLIVLLVGGVLIYSLFKGDNPPAPPPAPHQPLKSP
jgi:hypothetical protein